MQLPTTTRAWHILIAAIGGISLMSFLGPQSKPLANLLVWFPGSVESGQIWRLVTNALILIDPLSLVFELLFFWFILPTVEEDWGMAPVLIFFTVASVAAAATAMLLTAIGITIPFLFGPGAALLGFMYVFSKRNPDQTFRLFFVIPVQAKWFVVVYVAMRAVFSVTQPILLALLLAELAGALIALSLRAGFLALSGHRLKKKLASLNALKAKTAAPSGNTRLAKLVREKPEDSETIRLLEAEKKRSFDFTVCPLSDFSEEDRYCQGCEAFGHCLAKKTADKP